MSARLSFGLCAVAALALLAACNREPETETKAVAPPAAPADAAVTPAAAGAPLAYESKTSFANVELKLPAAIKSQPDLHALIYANAVRDLRRFTEGAQADRTEFGGDGDLPPYEKVLDVVPAGQSGKLISFQVNGYEYTGGAHPNSNYNAVIWDKALKRVVTPSQMFRPGVDLAPLDRALCQAINAAKKARSPDAQAVALGTSTTGWSCPRAIETPFVLAPSTTPGKLGGLTFLVGPYQVGPYAEGGYEIPVSHTAFRTLLAPAYADEFAGSVK